MWAEDATRIGTLRVRGPAGQPTALRLAVERQLAGAELQAPGAPPSSVLIVRRLTDPLPGRLRRRPGVVRADPAWERAVQRRLDGLYRAAARPADGPVPDGAAAVRFRDEAEMLAFLALDLRHGRAADRWWWRTLLRQHPGAWRHEPTMREDAADTAELMLRHRDYRHHVLDLVGLQLLDIPSESPEDEEERRLLLGIRREYTEWLKERRRRGS